MIELSYQVLAAAVCIAVCCLILIVWLSLKCRRLKRMAGSEKEQPVEETEKKQPDDGAQVRFLPQELFEILGVTDLSEMTEHMLDEQKLLETGIMDVNVAGFGAMINQMDAEEAYRFINQTLVRCIPEIYAAGGVVNQFREAGVAALFTSGLEQGLNAAVSICEEIAKLTDREGRYSGFSIGLCYGTVMVGMVGHKRRFSVLTLSAYTGFGAFLQKIAPKYFARILAAGSFVEKIPDFDKKYNRRFVGYIYISNNSTLEKIYDVFDGDEAAVRNQKRKTRMVFEKGVGLFLERRFSEARIHFIEVLKTDRYDRAAREYVLLCDRYGSRQEQEAADICIERY